mmetsp:Transcript_54114/g.150515  ORF Transcript_54114/g.150515 Transcript_54114/m.150515 type:complete len:378 (+) Transcript_54114:461-1594(+)
MLQWQTLGHCVQLELDRMRRHCMQRGDERVQASAKVVPRPFAACVARPAPPRTQRPDLRRCSGDRQCCATLGLCVAPLEGLQSQDGLAAAPSERYAGSRCMCGDKAMDGCDRVAALVVSQGWRSEHGPAHRRHECRRAWATLEGRCGASFGAMDQRSRVAGNHREQHNQCLENGPAMGEGVDGVDLHAIGHLRRTHGSLQRSHSLVLHRHRIDRCGAAEVDGARARAVDEAVALGAGARCYRHDEDAPLETRPHKLQLRCRRVPLGPRVAKPTGVAGRTEESAFGARRRHVQQRSLGVQGWWSLGVGVGARRRGVGRRRHKCRPFDGHCGVDLCANTSLGAGATTCRRRNVARFLEGPCGCRCARGYAMWRGGRDAS